MQQFFSSSVCRTVCVFYDHSSHSFLHRLFVKELMAVSGEALLSVFGIEVLLTYFVAFGGSHLLPWDLSHIIVHVIRNVRLCIGHVAVTYAILAHLAIIVMQVCHRVSSWTQVDIWLSPDQFHLVLGNLETRSDCFAAVTLDAKHVVLTKFAIAYLTVTLEDPSWLIS